MRVNSQPTTILCQINKKSYLNISKNENEPIKKNIEEIYNSLYEDHFFHILTVSKTLFLNRIDSKGKDLIDMIYNQNQKNNYMSLIKKVNIDINSRYMEDYKILYQSYKNIKNNIGHYNYLLNFRKHCEKTEEYAYHSCVNNNLKKIYEIRDNKNQIKYILCPDCKFCFLPHCIRLVCQNCNKEYFSSTIPENQDKNILLATWDKYHCGTIKNQIMKCIKCKKDLYINLITNKLVCLNKACNFSSKPLSILWKCSKCGRDFRSRPKIFNQTELEIIQKAINLTLLIKKKAYPKELPCCHRKPEELTFFHKDECKGILYMGILLDKEIVVCNKCHAMNFEEKFTWICPKCNVKFHLHQLTSIKPFRARKYIINRDHSLLSKRNNKSNINIRNLKNEINSEYNVKNLKNEKKYYNDIYKSIQPNDNDNSLYHNKNTLNKENYEKIEYFYNNESEKKIFSDYDRSCSNDNNLRKYKRIDSVSIDEVKKEEISDNNCQNISIGRRKLDFNKIPKKDKQYKTLLDILEKRKQKQSMTKMGRHLTNNEFSFNDLNSNNNIDRSSTGATNKEGLGNIYFKTLKNNTNSNKTRSDSKWQIITETKNENNLNEDENFIYKKKINITSYKKARRYNDKNCRLNDYKSQVVLLQDKQKKDRNISDINLNLNLNRYDEDKIVPIHNAKVNHSISTNSYIIDNDSLSKKSINNNSYKHKKDLQYFKLNNSSANIIENRIFKYNKRNNKNDINPNGGNNNNNNSNIQSLNSELQSLKSNYNRISYDDTSSNKIRVNEYYNKYRNSRIKNEEDQSRDRTNVNKTEDTSPKLVKNRNNYIYSTNNNKNCFIKYNFRHTTSDKKQLREKVNLTETDEIQNKSNDKPIKVSKIYHNKIIQKNSDKKKYLNIENLSNTNNNSNINYERKYDKNETIENINNKKENMRSKIYQMKLKKSRDKFSMNNIIATPDKIKEISRNCIIPTFDDDDYKYLRPIGEGSYGMIFLVKNVKSNKEYALKKILCKNLKEILKRKNQLELIYSMKHENIMKIFNLQFKYLDLTTYSLYVIMERAIGDWSLDIRKRILTKKYYKESEIINILKQVVGALSYLEQRKIAHRDIKPQNILIFPGKIYKVADLGEAKNIDNVSREMTLRGSELYMSPLIYQHHKLNKRDLIHNAFKSDVFSLGYSTLYAICLNLNVLEDMRELDNMKSIISIIDKYYDKKLFSEKLYRLIINMIEIDENKRYSFKEIDKELKYW